MNNQELIARHQSALIGNYGKLPAVLVRGVGSLVYDADGKGGDPAVRLAHLHTGLTLTDADFWVFA